MFRAIALAVISVITSSTAGYFFTIVPLRQSARHISVKD